MPVHLSRTDLLPMTGDCPTICVGMTEKECGVYWKPVWAILEDDFDCLLVNARHVKQVPGRKTDVSDAAWLCQLLEAVLLQRSFVPPKPIRALRNLTRYRKARIGERQREANRLHKILEDTGIKLDRVATDILGASGRAMLDALVAGTTDPEVLAELAKGKLRAKIPALKQALVGRSDRQHALIVSAILAHLDFLDEQIQLLSDEIEAQLAPFSKAIELHCTIPGVQRRIAAAVIAEIGTDMSRFPSERHLASWAGQRPGNDRPAGKRRWHDAPRKQVARHRPLRSSHGRHPNRRRLPRCAVPPSATSTRTRPRARRRQALDPLRLLADAPHRSALPRTRRRLLHPPRPRTHHQPTRCPSRTTSDTTSPSRPPPDQLVISDQTRLPRKTAIE
jgi:transposase